MRARNSYNRLVWVGIRSLSSIMAHFRHKRRVSVSQKSECYKRKKVVCGRGSLVRPAYCCWGAGVGVAPCGRQGRCYDAVGSSHSKHDARTAQRDTHNDPPRRPRPLRPPCPPLLSHDDVPVAATCKGRCLPLSLWTPTSPKRSTTSSTTNGRPVLSST